MKKVLALVFALLLCNNAAASNCEGILEVELSQSRFSLDIWQHAKDAMNSVKFKLPVSCDFYDQVNVGQNLLKERFRTGSLLISGSIGNWNLKVVRKVSKSQ